MSSLSFLPLQALPLQALRETHPCVPLPPHPPSFSPDKEHPPPASNLSPSASNHANRYRKVVEAQRARAHAYHPRMVGADQDSEFAEYYGNPGRSPASLAQARKQRMRQRDRNHALVRERERPPQSQYIYPHASNARMW